jgi:integrase/recombinase XerC
MSQSPPDHHNLEHAWNVTIESSIPTLQGTPDVLEELLAEKRSPDTKREYRKDLILFFRAMFETEPTPDTIWQFLHLEHPQAVRLVLKYKTLLLARGKNQAKDRVAPLAENTINRRLAAIKSLIAMGKRLGVCHYTLSTQDVRSERVQQYRDTTGITPDVFYRVLESIDRETLTGLRDYALLMLLWANALRRNEIVQATVRDFDPDNRTLRILGKGRGSQYDTIDLGVTTTEALVAWLGARENLRRDAPLFIALDFAHKGHGLTGDGIRKVVVKRCKQAGVTKPMSPHRIRHSAITAALNATDGDVRKVQKLSRHRRLDTLMIYDDNRGNDQAQITEILEQLF